MSINIMKGNQNNPHETLNKHPSLKRASIGLSQRKDDVEQSPSLTVINNNDDGGVFVEVTPSTGMPVPDNWSSQVSYVPIDKSVVDIFEFYAARQPNSPAIRWGNEQWSYDSLNEQANRIANLLRSRDYGIRREEPVAFFMEQSAYPVLAALAIVKAGGSYVPLDPTFQQSHIEYVLQNTGAKILIHDDTTADRCADLIEFDGQFLDLDEDIELILEQSSKNPKNVFGINGDSRFHIIYTSGSTGKPKGIEILHKGSIRLSLNTNWIDITSSSKFASMANYAFDASSFEIWSSLLNGAEIVVLPRSAALNPNSLQRFLKDNKVTQLFLTTQLFHFVARERPDAFGSLDQIVVGGEALSPEWCKAVLESGNPPKRLTNGYGPAENSAASSFHDVTLDDIREGYSVPIGIPLTNSEVLVLNEKMKPVKIGDVGEICLSGPGVARGYMNRPDITAEKFVDHPFKSGEKLYRSGDLARWSTNGLLYYEGRRDRQVKIRGFRIELSGIEAVIRKVPHLIRDVAVIVREDRPGNRKIVAYCIPKEDIFDNIQKIHGLCAKVRVFLESEMPSYMVPSAFIVVSELPITPNGKLNTKKLPRVSDILDLDPGRQYPPSTDTEKAVAQIWIDLLNLKSVSVHAEFQDLGGDSLNAAKLLLLVEDKFSVKCPAYEFFGQPTISNLSRLIDLLKSQGSSHGEEEGPYLDLAKEIRLDPEIQPEGQYSFNVPKNIFLTGATGFLGAYILRDLLRDGNVKKIFVLTRAKDDDDALQRIRSNLMKYEIWKEGMELKISAISGDFSKDSFGMSESEYKDLCSIVDTVVHCGAKVDYTAPYANHKDVNVDGTVEVIKFCFHGIQKTLHFLSTLAVFGPIGFVLGTENLYEDTDLMPSIEPLQADMGYAQSKWVAEMILGLAKTRGLRVNVFRPGFIFCDGRTGLSNTADFMVRCTVACIKLGYYPLLHNQSKEFLTVDFASAAILALAKEERHLNKNYHLVRHDAKKQPSVTKYFEMLRGLGYDLRAMEFRDWVDVLSRACMEEERHPMLPLMPMMAETIRDDRTRWEMYDDMPTIHCDNLQIGLQGSGVTFTNIEEDLLAKYLDYIMTKGLLPSREQIDQPMDRTTMRLTMKGKRTSSARLKYRPSGRRMARLSAFLSEAGSDRKSLFFSVGDNTNDGLFGAPPLSSNGSNDICGTGGISHQLGAKTGFSRISRVSGFGAPRLSRLQGAIRESFEDEARASGGKADFSVQALIRAEFDYIDEELNESNEDILLENKGSGYSLDSPADRSSEKLSLAINDAPSDELQDESGAPEKKDEFSIQTLKREEYQKIDEELSGTDEEEMVKEATEAQSNTESSPSVRFIEEVASISNATESEERQITFVGLNQLKIIASSGEHKEQEEVQFQSTSPFSNALMQMDIGLPCCTLGGTYLDEDKK